MLHATPPQMAFPHYSASRSPCKGFPEKSHKKNKRPPRNGSLLLSYVAISSVETIMLDSILACFYHSVNSFLKIFQKIFPFFYFDSKRQKTPPFAAVLSFFGIVK
jgi:hypothetical protein